MCNSSWCEAFGDVKLCFWWGKAFLQINGVLVPVERSLSSLKGVLCISKEMESSKGLLHMFKTCCDFQWVKPFLQTNGVLNYVFARSKVFCKVFQCIFVVSKVFVFFVGFVSAFELTLEVLLVSWHCYWMWSEVGSWGGGHIYIYIIHIYIYIYTYIYIIHIYIHIFLYDAIYLHLYVRSHAFVLYVFLTRKFGWSGGAANKEMGPDSDARSFSRFWLWRKMRHKPP